MNQREDDLSRENGGQCVSFSMRDPLHPHPWKNIRAPLDRNGDLDSGAILFPKRVWLFDVLIGIFLRMFRKHWGVF